MRLKFELFTELVVQIHMLVYKSLFRLKILCLNILSFDETNTKILWNNAIHAYWVTTIREPNFLLSILSHLNGNTYKLMKIAINVWKTSFAIYTEKQLFLVLSDYQKKKTSASLKCS